MRFIIALLMLSSTARAQDAFEIQVYDSQTAAPATAGFELHLNTGGDHLTHFTLEPHVGLLAWLEAGAYFQTVLRGDDRFDYGGVKLRLKARVPRRLGGVVGLALNGEVSIVPKPYEDGVGGELRPIVDVSWRRLYFSVNPIVSFDRHGVDFEPAVKATVRIVGPLGAGAEYYAAVRPKVQRLLGVIDVERGRLSLNFGADYTFGERQWTVKAIVGLEI
jgi:hypothetical protein